MWASTLYKQLKLPALGIYVKIAHSTQQLSVGTDTKQAADCFLVEIKFVSSCGRYGDWQFEKTSWDTMSNTRGSNKISPELMDKKQANLTHANQPRIFTAISVKTVWPNR